MILCSVSVALFTKILTIKYCRKCKTKIKKSFTKILTIILSVKIILTLRVKLPCLKCKILIVREIFVRGVTAHMMSHHGVNIVRL
jgi:hypothetical protein